MSGIAGLRHFLACTLLLAALPAVASGLRVSPLRLDLSASQTTTHIELSNFGATPVPVQVSAFRWSQVDGRDAYEPARDIFFAPPIVSVPAGGTTVVRFRLRGAAPKDQERPYRIYFQEMAPPQAQNQGGMSFRLKFGVPLFVAAVKPAAPRLEVAREVSAGQLKLDLANTGTAHLKIQGMELYPAGVDRENPPAAAVARATHSELGANYLLPGTHHTWSLALPAKTDPAHHVLLIRTDDYSGKAAPGMTPKGWLWHPLAPAGATTR